MAKTTSSSQPFTTTSSSTFLPAGLGNSVACYTAACPEDAAASSSKSSSSGAVAKGKGRVNGGKKEQQGSSTTVKFVQFDALPKGRRTFTTETYTVYASLQTIANGYANDELEGDDEDGMAVTAFDKNIPRPSQIAYYSRFAHLYRDCLSRYLQKLGSEEEVDTEELSLIGAIRDVFQLAHLIYIPEDGKGDGIVSEEIADWVNTTSPWPTAERRQELTSMSAPYENGDFWGFIYTCILRGHFNLAVSVLSKLLGHPSAVLQRLTRSCVELISTIPRSTSSTFTYESAFLTALRQWRSKLSALLSRLDLEMDEFQEEIEAEQDQDDSAMDDDDDAAADERFEWQAGFKSLLMLLAGDTSSILEGSEDGWKSALTAWCLLVRPGLKRDDLPETVQTIVGKLPHDQTVFKESTTIALLTGDVPKVLGLAADTDTWLVAHICDLFHKLGLLSESPPLDEISLRDYFVLAYADMLCSDPALWRCTVDYLGSLENADVGLGRMRELLLSIGSTASTDIPDVTADVNGPIASETEDAVEKVKKQTKKTITVEDVLAICAVYDLEDVARNVCLMTAETLVSQKKYGMAIAYCVRANDSRRINKIADLILDRYVEMGVEALSLIDSIPTSLLHPNSATQASFPGLDAQDPSSQLAFVLSTSTRLSFLARYRDFHALYASGDRAAAAELLVLLMSSNAAPRKFWAVMLLDSVALLNDPDMPVSEQNTMELMRCLSEIVLPLQESGQDLYGHFECMSRIEGGEKTSQQPNTQGSNRNTEESEREMVAGVLRQMDVVRYALTQNLSRCFLHR